MRRFLALFIASLMLIPSAAFGIERVGTTAYQVLKLGVGVRGIGMGNAYVAGTTEASAIYWNPAGLGWMRNHEALLTHINLPADIAYDLVGLAIPFGSTGTFGLNLAVLHMDDMEVRTAEQPEGTGELFTASDIVLGVSFSRAISDRFTFGVSAKYIREELADFVSQNVSFDAGLQYQTAFRSMKLGMVIQNFGPDGRFGGHFDDYRTPQALLTGRPESHGFEKAVQPISFKAGIIADFESFFGVDLGPSIQASLAGQFEHPGDNQERLNGGVEFWLYDRIALRGGYIFNSDSDTKLEGRTKTTLDYNTNRFTLGFGVKVPLVGNQMLKFDYAYADQGDLTDTSSFFNQPHRFSIALQF